MLTVGRPRLSVMQVYTAEYKEDYNMWFIDNKDYGTVEHIDEKDLKFIDDQE